MNDDAAQLRDFYRTPLGQAARRIIARRVRAHWPNVAQMDMAGLGFATPYLRMFQGEARAITALMPEAQGVLHWPRTGPCRTALVAEAQLPLRDMSVERVIVAHGLEHAQNRQAYLAEIWRILMPQGRVLIVAPNRRGPWARLDTTPFGHGRPYSSSQMERLLRKTMFEPVGMTPCLFLPPFRFRAVGPAALVWERFGQRLWPVFSGVIIVEAVKQMYAGLLEPVQKPAFKSIPMALPGLRPVHSHIKRRT